MDSKHQHAPLQMRLFGPFDVQVQGQPLPHLRTRKGQWLLALLALRHGREVAREWLAGTLWPDSTESQALANLRLSLADLRRALGGQAYRLRSPTSQSLVLDLEGASVDVLAFDAAIAAGDAASLQQAVDLYRGPLLEGCSEEWALSHGQTRDQVHLKALEQLAELAMTVNRPKEAIGYLRQLIAGDPLRESAHRRLMEAFGEDGDYAAAVSAYRDLRLYLRKHVNAQPDSQTTALFRQLRDQAQERLQTLHAAPPPREEPVTAVPHRLPRPMSSLVDRQQEVREVAGFLRVHRLVTLTGAGGVGKTRLSIAVAEEIADDYPDGVFFVDLAALTDGAVVPQVVASTLGLREQPDRSPMAGLRDFLESRTLLLILDNCEHLLQDCTQLVSALLDSSAHLRILATSRHLLGLTGEQTWRVPSLPVPDCAGFSTNAAQGGEIGRGETGGGEKDSMSQWMAYGSIQLFVERARLVQSSLRWTAEDMRTVGEICRRLDGIPLAIELAAARVKVLSIEQIASRLEDRFRFLTGGSRSALPRQQTLRALLDWSYGLLTVQEQALLCRLSVFADGWTLAAAEEVCTDEAIEDWEILDVLNGLVDKSLVLYERRGREARYSLLETVRQYGRNRLLDQGAGDKERRRHRDHFLAVAEQAEPELKGSRQTEWLERLEDEHDNFRAALEWCAVEPEGGAEGLRLAAALGRFWKIRGHLSEGRRHLERTLCCVEAPDQTRGRALFAAGVLAYDQGDFTAARALYEEHLALCRKLQNKQGIASSLSNLGSLANTQGDLTAAKALHEESLALKRELDDKEGVGLSLGNLGLVASNQGDYVAAKAFLEESLVLFRQVEDKERIATLFNLLGVVAYDQSDYVAAAAYYTESLNLHQQLQNKRGISTALNNLGNIASFQSDYPAAAAFYTESLSLLRELGDRKGIALSLSNLGNINRQQGNYRVARALLSESLNLKREIGDKLGTAITLEAFAALAAREDRPEHATRLCGAAEALRAKVGAPLPADEEYDREVSGMRERLGTDLFALTWQAGQSMTLEQAVTCALNGPSG